MFHDYKNYIVTFIIVFSPCIKVYDKNDENLIFLCLSI